MPSLRGFHHVALTVTDLDASADWYVRVLGMTEAFREAGGERRAAVLRLGDGVTSLGLVQHGGPGSPFDPTVTGLDHVAFEVTSPEELSAWAARLDELGIDHSGAIEVPPGLILNFKDPDGVALALFWDRDAT